MAANDMDFTGGQAAATIADVSAGDGLGTITRTAGVPLTKLLLPAKDKLTRLTSYDYKSAATAHTLAAMVPLGDVMPTVTQDVAVNGTVIYISDPIFDSTGNAPASGDWIAVRGGDGVLMHFQVASYALKAITITGTQYYGDANGTGVPVAIPTGNLVWFFGSPTADHPNRQFITEASTRLIKAVAAYSTTPKTYQPMIVYSSNATNAATVFEVTYDNPSPK